MDGYGSEYPNFFSRSSSPVDPMASSLSFSPNADNFVLFSQALPYGPGSSARRIEGLDLNSDADGYPHIDSYRGLLQADSVPRSRGLPPLRIGTRSGGVPFVPPRTTGGASGSRKRPAARAAGRCTKAASCSARAESTANRVFRGSVVADSSIPPMDAYDAHTIEQEDDNGVEDGANNQTTIGRLANGGIDAPLSWWEKHTKEARVQEIHAWSCLCIFHRCKSFSRTLLLMALHHASLD